MPRWSKIALRIFGILVGLVILVFIGLAWYVNAHKKELLVTITKQLNGGISGQITIESMEPTFLRGFPGVSMRLNNVIVRDSLWEQHKHSLLEAKDIEVSVNALKLLTGTIQIKKMGINNASIYLYTDSNGYSNTAIFKKKSNIKVEKKENSESNLEIRRLSLNNVNFLVDNKKGNKLFHFVVDDLDGNIDYSWSDWEAKVNLKAIAKSLAFNTKRGSFIKDQLLEGPFKLTYEEAKGLITVTPNTLNIGKDLFVIGAKFDMSKSNTDFFINIQANDIMWKNAAGLLAPNISSRLNMFNLDKSIDVTCTIAGNMGPGGDPEINVKAIVKNNKLTTPGGIVSNCNFTGIFTNNFEQGKGHTDQNSAIKLFNFKGAYENMPFSIDTASINDLNRPIATGMFKSNFDIKNLNNAMGDDVLKFGKGTANVSLAYRADIVDFKLAKPFVKGLVEIKNADVSYVPRHVKFTNTNISLNFTDRDLFIKNIRLQSGKSVVYMDGSISNFLNLYYSDPEKILL
ncbi:MAG: AsmA family protein, partial [Pedobacter sp.]|nr:AsmA family protein [Pedobacter sp.]